MRRWDHKIWFYDCDGGSWRGTPESMTERREVGVDTPRKYRVQKPQNARILRENHKLLPLEFITLLIKKKMWCMWHSPSTEYMVNQD